MKIKCPHCNSEFDLESTDQQQILAQIKDKSFDDDVNERVELELSKLKSEQDIKIKDIKHEKDLEIANLKVELKDKEAKLETANKQKKLEIKEAVNDKEKELNTKHQNELKKLEDENKRLKEYKLSMNNKVVGESLEQWCEDEFNKIRMTAFPNAYFEKDNKVSTKSNSKGDYIFRNFVDGIETISIMFDMKNESETRGKKKKNEAFFKELDKDRNEKGCEYAILVSMLEQDSDFYNQGIVQVYQYPKMFVVRPQCFLTIIGILSNSAATTATAKKDLALATTQNIDVYKLKQNIENFVGNLAENCSEAQDRFDLAIESIDKSIRDLQNVKENLLASKSSLSLVSSTIEEVSIQQLCETNRNNEKENNI